MIRGMGFYRDGQVATVDGLARPGEPVDAHVGDDLAGWLGGLYRRARAEGDTTFLWLGLFQPSRAELLAVQDALGLPSLLVEDAGNPRQRAKLERGDETAFELMKVLGYLEPTSDVETGQIAVFIGPGYAVTVRFGVLGDLRGVRSRLEESPDLLRHGPVSVLYAIADAVVDGYLSVADEITRDIEAIEETVFSPARTNDAEAIYRLKRENLEVRRAVLPMVPMAHDLVRERVGAVPRDLRPYFHDIADHLLRANDLSESADSLLMTMLMASTARQDLQQNADMRKISAWVAIAAVPTMIAGIYGMNFDFMPELHSQYGYPLVLLGMLTIAALMFRAFKRSGWL